MALKGPDDRLAAATACALLFLLPFEPRTLALPAGGLRFTVLEVAAAAAGAVLAWASASRLKALLARPPLALVLAGAFAAASVAAAVLAPAYRTESLHFALRMCALAVFACIFAAGGRPCVRAGLAGLIAAGSLVAVLAIAEGAGFTRLDPLLDAFREMRFNVGGARRATGGTAYPTLAAAWMVAALLAAVPLSRARPRPLVLAAAATALFAPGLLFTYSRGALAAALAGLCALAAVSLRAGDRRGALAAGTAGAIGLGCALLFAARGEVFRLRLGSEGSTAWYGARYTPAEQELSLGTGEARPTSVRVANTGRKAWSAADGFALSYHWFDPVGRRLLDGPRTPLPRTLAFGDEAALEPVLYAPAQPGCYLLVWDVVQEHTTWLSGQGVPPVAVPAQVGAAGSADCAGALPPSMRMRGQPPRRELWAAAWAMWRDRPWTGVGPDNFRRLYGRYAGRTFWDDRVTANSLLLETLAGSGLPGALALFGMLGAAGVAATRVAITRAAPGRAEAAAVLAVLVATLTHGVVDCLIGFTGTYLLIAFLVGAAVVPEAARARMREPELERGAA